MCAELFGEIGLVGAARDRSDLEPHVPRVLHTEVPEAPDAQHRDEIARLRWRVTKSAERCKTGAEQWRGGYRGEVVGHRDQSARFGDHYLRITAIVLDARVLLVLAIDEITVAAKLTVPAASTKESNADALPDHPALHAGPECIYPTNGLVTGNAGPLDRKEAFDSPRV